MPACFVTGEAAGCAAALIVKSEQCTPRTVDTDMLRERLRSKGAYFL